MKQFGLHYRGSLFWLIFWIIVFFPIALVLLFTAFSFDVNDKRYGVYYAGSRFWLCFWILVFFPIAFALIFVNGIAMRVENIPFEKTP